MNPLWRLRHAQGFLMLGKTDLAAEELRMLPEEWQEREEALTLRSAVLHEQHEWNLLCPIAAQLVRLKPKEAQWWILWAYATRRADSLAAAEAILREAELQHKTDGTIQYNLACYACQQGQLKEARARLRHAIALEPHFEKTWLEDDDLKALEGSLE